MKRIYLDYAAATPVDPAVLEAMTPFFIEEFYNPSALYAPARKVRIALEQARSSVARSLGVRPSEIIFTAGGTESANLAITGSMSRFPDKEVLLSAVEHDAVRAPATQYNYQFVDVDNKGIIKLDDLRQKIGDNTVLVSVMTANNEVGSLQPIDHIAVLLEEVRSDRRAAGSTLPLYFHTDACQAPLYLDTHVTKGLDLMTLNGGKMHGPKQSGVLYVRTGVKLTPHIRGGGQEFGLRNGTENVAFAIGFATALEQAVKGQKVRATQVSELRNYFIDRLEKLGGVINGHKSRRLANNVHVTFPNTDNERVLFALDDLGVAAAAGSACSASKDLSSHVLLAMGKSDEQARSSLRFSLGVGTTKKEIDLAIEKITHALDA